ncbi:hypothetical protein [uncultured Arcticibacterium sp.]|uniref:hypothetical protein n=1 Tax=uncultured Arcticibacterium sp. TaxID=2173042 RepID=UPI0030FCA926
MKKIILLSVLLFSSTSLWAAVVILNGLTHVHSVSSGDKITGQVVLRNESEEAKRVIFYKQDFTAYCGEGNKYLDASKTGRSLGKWLSTTLDEKTLEPNEEYTLFYSIELPSSLEKGSYWSVLMIEGADPVNKVQPNGISVNSVMRYAVQIIADNGTAETSGLLVSDLNMKDASETIKEMKVTVKNNGEFSEKVRLYLEVYDEDGNKIETFRGLNRRIYPHMCSTYVLELKDLPKGTYESVLVMDNSKDLFASNITLDID